MPFRYKRGIRASYARQVYIYGVSLNYKNLTIGDLADGIAPEYSSVNQKISEETERSIRYLREVLEIEKEH